MEDVNYLALHNQQAAIIHSEKNKKLYEWLFNNIFYP